MMLLLLSSVVDWVLIKFFPSVSCTSLFYPGLLDAEELASMTEGDGRDVKQQLQGIEEKLCRSMDSISTLPHL
ncbi:hypothetical protein L6452_01045 [Arctium lappa]|uniref:Uncharacterized protein n=1 Tax=Arctium lappa TaxID=4217 RepID=A0ACB9FGV5_ARCLA|nr:hypothetical protein L6452_01045 [Arctium lappa]